jgi:hypothetical protein
VEESGAGATGLVLSDYQRGKKCWKINETDLPQETFLGEGGSSLGLVHDYDDVDNGLLETVCTNEPACSPVKLNIRTST